MKPPLTYGIIVLLILGPAQQIYAINFGDSPVQETQAESSGQNSQVEVTNLPIQHATKKIDGEDQSIPYLRVTSSDYFIQEIGKDITLANNESFESDPIDVREYRDVSFYVVPDSMLGDESECVYQLDAFFSVTPSSQKTQKMGEKKGTELNGWQEFGNMKIDSKTNETHSSFRKLSTGETSSRVLATKIYGPFVRVTLKNFSVDSKRKFKIYAYLTR